MEATSISRNGPTATIAPRRLLRDVDIADRLAISRRSARYLVERGLLPVVRFGRCARVDERDLESFLTRHWTPPRRSLGEIAAAPRLAWMSYRRVAPAGAAP